LPATIGAILFEVKAHTDDSWRLLVTRMISFYATSLFNPVWGEQIRFNPGRTMSVSMLFHGLDEKAARAVWTPLLDWLGERKSAYTLQHEPVVIALSGRSFWDPAVLRDLPGIVLTDERAGAPASNIYWAGNRSEAGQTLYAYESAWLPASLLERSDQSKLVDALVDASAKWSITLHTNKGLAGGADEALARTRQTATNPAVLDAFALVICAAEGPPSWPGIPGYEPNPTEAREQAAGVSRAMAPIYRLIPDAGAYVSETNYFTSDWKRAYWGDNYARLAAAKRRYDPENLFRVQHGVQFE
jgi:hypothetical protein